MIRMKVLFRYAVIVLISGYSWGQETSTSRSQNPQPVVPNENFRDTITGLAADSVQVQVLLSSGRHAQPKIQVIKQPETVQPEEKKVVNSARRKTN